MTAADLRTKRTQLAIQNALFALLQRREYHEISVLDICSEAMVNPKTFYKYYAGKNALVGALIEEVKSEMDLLRQQRLAANGALFLKVSVPYFMKRRQMFAALWKIDTEEHHLWRDMFDNIKQIYLSVATARHPDRPHDDRDYQSEMFAVVLMHTFRYATTRPNTLSTDFFDQLQEMLDTMKL